MDGTVSARTLSRMWLLTISVTGIALLYLAKVVFLPLAFAILFAFLLAPLVSRLERFHLPRTAAALAVILAFAALLTAAGWVFFTQLVAVANDLPIYRDNIEEKLNSFHQPSDSAYAHAEQEVEKLSEEVGLAANSSPAAPAAHPNNGAKKPIGTSPDHPIQVREVAKKTGRLDEINGMLGTLTTALLAVVFTFFVLLEREDLRNRLIRLSGDRNLTVVTQAMNDASHRISRYFGLQLLVNAMFGGIVLAVLWAVGLPHPVLFAALAALVRFVPYVGWPIAAGLSTGLAMAVFQGWHKSLLIAGTFFLVEMVTGNYIEPRVYGKHTGLSSMAILVAATFWTLIWGPVGLVLSVPLTVCLVVMGRHIPTLEFLSVMLGDQPAIEPWVCYYQRLLARDEREAAHVLEKAVKTSSLEGAYDSVLIPALAMSEEDRQHNDLENSTIRYIRGVVREAVDELGFRENRGPESRVLERQASDSIKELPSAHQMNVLCVPVREDTDELATQMLMQLLDNGVTTATSVPWTRLDENLKSSDGASPDVVFLSALPPVGIARCHRLYRTIRARNLHTRILIGIWNFPEQDAADAASRISGGEEARVWTRLTEAVAEVRAMARGVNAAAGEPATATGQTAA